MSRHVGNSFPSGGARAFGPGGIITVRQASHRGQALAGENWRVQQVRSGVVTFTLWATRMWVTNIWATSVRRGDTGCRVTATVSRGIDVFRAHRFRWAKRLSGAQAEGSLRPRQQEAQQGGRNGSFAVHHLPLRKPGQDGSVGITAAN